MPRDEDPRGWRALGVGAALTALLAVIAMTARGRLSPSSAIDARSAAAPVTALYLLGLGVGIVGLTALGVLLWPGRRRRGDDEGELERTEPEIHWLVKLAAVVLPFALGAALVVAVAVGVKSTGRSAVPASGQPRPVAPRLPPASASRVRAQGFTVPAWLPWTLLAILLTALAVGLWLLWRRWREPDGVGAQRPTPMAAAVQEAIVALDSVEDPRAAVIAAYGAMQQTLAAYGVPRQPAEAPREYLGRLLRASAASEQDARTLTGLFEEARFSTHSISAPIRHQALSALSAIRATIAAMSR